MVRPQHKTAIPRSGDYNLNFDYKNIIILSLHFGNCTEFVVLNHQKSEKKFKIKSKDQKTTFLVNLTENFEICAFLGPVTSIS